MCDLYPHNIPKGIEQKSAVRRAHLLPRSSERPLINSAGGFHGGFMEGFMEILWEIQIYGGFMGK